MNKYFFIISVFFLSSCARTGSFNNPNAYHSTPISFEDADLNKDNVLDKKEALTLFKEKRNTDSKSPFWVFIVLVGLILFTCSLPLASSKVSKALRLKNKT